MKKDIQELIDIVHQSGKIMKKNFRKLKKEPCACTCHTVYVNEACEYCRVV